MVTRGQRVKGGKYRTKRQYRLNVRHFQQFRREGGRRSRGRERGKTEVG